MCQVPALVGTNQEDGLILTTSLVTDPSLYLLYRWPEPIADITLSAISRSLWSVIAPGILFHVPVEESSIEMSQKAVELAEFYLGGTKNIVPDNFANITDMFTDAFVTYAMECFVSHARMTQPVFQYRYVHQVTILHLVKYLLQGEHGLNPDSGLPKMGVNHGDELYLMFDPIFLAERQLNEEDARMSSLLIELWTSFVKSGVPSSRSS